MLCGKSRFFITSGNRALDCANYLAGLFKVMEESKRMDFLDMVNDRLIWPATSALTSKSSNAAREKVWSSFRKTLLDTTLRNRFFEMFPESSNPPPLLFSHMMFELLNITLNQCLNSLPTKVSGVDIKLTDG